MVLMKFIREPKSIERNRIWTNMKWNDSTPIEFIRGPKTCLKVMQYVAMKTGGKIIEETPNTWSHILFTEEDINLVLVKNRLRTNLGFHEIFVIKDRTIGNFIEYVNEKILKRKKIMYIEKMKSLNNDF